MDSTSQKTYHTFILFYGHNQASSSCIISLSASPNQGVYIALVTVASEFIPAIPEIHSQSSDLNHLIYASM